jgi:hypothetical protein
VAVIGQLEAAGMAKHVRVDWEWHVGGLPRRIPLDERAASTAAAIEIFSFPERPGGGGPLDFQKWFWPLLRKLGRKPFLGTKYLSDLMFSVLGRNLRIDTRLALYLRNRRRPDRRFVLTRSAQCG